MNFRPYQQEALNAILQAMECGKRIINVAMATGTGKTAVLVELIKQLCFGKGEILVLVSRRDIQEQVALSLRAEDIPYGKDNFGSDNKEAGLISLSTFAKLQKAFQEARPILAFKYIIFFDVADVGNIFFERMRFSTIIGFSGFASVSKGPFADVSPVYQYSLEEAIKDGYLSDLSSPMMYGLAVEGFCARLVTSLGFKIHNAGGNHSYPDLVASFQGRLVYFEAKTYRSKTIQKTDINRAISEMLRAKGRRERTEQAAEYCLILFANVSDEQKAACYEECGITLWDTSNVLYFVRDNRQLLDELLRIVLFPVGSIEPAVPIGWGRLLRASTATPPFVAGHDVSDELGRRLSRCKAGKTQAAEYEAICSDIIGYLFGSEFTIQSPQHRTSDELFRMDMLCTLKGSCAFWEFLIRHYNSRFVVFEFKNYSAALSQNYVYITEKYLFNAALRNVAIIISRNGFSRNADVAAEGCLKEHGKLVLDVTDKDLIKMLQMKASGEEPSDYLLGKTEAFLMSISK